MGTASQAGGKHTAKKDTQKFRRCLWSCTSPYWDCFWTFHCIKKFTCCILGCTDNAGDKNGSATTICSNMVKHWQLRRILYRRSQIGYFCLNDTSALTAFLTSCPLGDCVLYPFVYLLCCRNCSYDSSCQREHLQVWNSVPLGLEINCSSLMSWGLNHLKKRKVRIPKEGWELHMRSCI